MMRSTLSASVIGAGYAGLATAVGIAEQGHSVTLVEIDPRRRADLLRQDVPIYEPHLSEAYETQFRVGRLRVRATVPKRGQDLIVVCVGTPTTDNGSADVFQVARALTASSAAVNAGAICVIRSTLPVGTAARLLSMSGLPAGSVLVCQSSSGREVLSQTFVTQRELSSAHSHRALNRAPWYSFNQCSRRWACLRW